ncbi:hypothetical protein [Serratia marcescens]|uniref:hypothetical protein n=1 Tax=Serratia marcescens TaxID=615 RepID=UPI001117866A|nr:hypothetical protein [Serratia marcescens]
MLKKTAYFILLSLTLSSVAQAQPKYYTCAVRVNNGAEFMYGGAVNGETTEAGLFEDMKNHLINQGLSRDANVTGKCSFDGIHK